MILLSCFELYFGLDCMEERFWRPATVSLIPIYFNIVFEMFLGIAFKKTNGNNLVCFFCLKYKIE